MRLATVFSGSTSYLNFTNFEARMKNFPVNVNRVSCSFDRAVNVYYSRVFFGSVGVHVLNKERGGGGGARDINLEII